VNVGLLPLVVSPVRFEHVRDAVAWQQRSTQCYGKVHAQPRLTCWYGDTPYTYSRLTWPALAMPALLADLRARVEAATGERFNSVLCNLYRDGADTIGWHADDEPVFGGDPVVASLSFGATRRFVLRHMANHRRKHAFDLADGSLLVMGRGVQAEWQHSVPRCANAGPRINLTFRQTVS
jgi:alkylated DNA repair dioxygenase AlkB